MQYIGFKYGYPFEDALAELASLPKLRTLDVLVSKRTGYKDIENSRGHERNIRVMYTPFTLKFQEGKEGNR